MIEKAVVREDGSVTFDDDVTVGRFGRAACRLHAAKRGRERLASAGSIIRPTDLAALAMGGATMAPRVRVKPRAAFAPRQRASYPQASLPTRSKRGHEQLHVQRPLIEYGAEPVVFLVHDDPVELESRFRGGVAT